MTTVDRFIIDWFNSGFNGAAPEWCGNMILIILSLIMAALLSAALGLEREYQGHAAGLRTHLLVSIGSALIMIISMYGFGGDYPNRDPARLAAQVVSGIGFLGAGTIVQTGIDVKGLTTATTLWVVMAIGLACGSGNFVIAIAATIIAFISLVSLRRAERFLTRRNPILTVVVPSDKPILKDLILIASRYSVAIHETKTELVSYQENSALRISLRCTFPTPATISSFIDEIRFSIRPLEVNVSSENQ